MNDSMNMYDDFSNVVSNEESISTESVLDVLKEYAGTISVFDLMAVNAEMIEESKYVQDSYKHKSHEVYAKYFLGRIKDVHSDDNKYEHDIDKEEFIDAISTLKSYHIKDQIPVNLWNNFNLHHFYSGGTHPSGGHTVSRFPIC